MHTLRLVPKENLVMQEYQATKVVNSVEILNDMPLGQKLLKAGFNTLTDSDLRIFLKCDEIDKVERPKIINKRQEGMRTSILQERPKAYGFKFRNTPSETWCYYKVPLSLWPLFQMYCRSERYKFPVCTIKKVPLNEYATSVIPDRCYKSIQKAKQAGIKDFQVAYPIIEYIAQTDPIIIGLVGETMYYIDEWI